MSNTVNISMSYKSLVVGVIIILSTLLGGNAGLSFLISPSALADSQITTLDAKLVNHIDADEVNWISQQVSAAQTESNSAEINSLRGLVRQNAEQLNRLIGRVDQLLEKD